MTRPELTGDNKRLYEAWRAIGMRDEAALNSLKQSGWLPMSEEAKLARRFQDIFGLSESEARRAVHGHGGSSERPVSETAGRPSAGPQPGDALRLVRRIEELAAGLCDRGVSGEKALREAAFQVFRAAPDDATQEWIAQVTGRRWPELWGRGSRGSGQKRSSSGRTGGTVRG